MKIWLNDVFLGAFQSTAEVESALDAWKKANKEQVFYLIECQGEQFSFRDMWEQFLKDNIAQDIEVRIKTATPEKLRLELVDSTIEYLERLVGSIDDLAAQFYAGPDQAAWKKLSDFLEGLDYICQALKLLNIDFDQDQFNQMLQEFMQTMESQDIVTVADLLSYEWKSWLENVLDTINPPSN